jgi:hypothetical protein
VMLLVISCLYTLSGPLHYAASLFRRRGDPPPAVVVEEAH